MRNGSELSSDSEYRSVKEFKYTLRYVRSNLSAESHKKNVFVRNEKAIRFLYTLKNRIHIKGDDGSEIDDLDIPPFAGECFSCNE